MGSAETDRVDTYRRVLLVGFMGSGKTAVGEALAARLGWRFVDFDREIEAECGKDIPAIFRDHGESYFRDVESAVAERCLGLERVVLASGGGWPTRAGRMRCLPPGTLSVWLKVSAREAVSRVERDGPTRPLLERQDPLARMQELLEAREEWYALADVTVSTDDREPQSLAQEIGKHVSKADSSS